MSLYLIVYHVSLPDPLCHKQSFANAFLKQNLASLSNYDVTKISKVLDHIVAVCTDIAVRGSHLTGNGAFP